MDKTLQKALNDLAGTTGLTVQGALNNLAGTVGRTGQEAANVWAGTVGLSIQDAINRKAGTVGLTAQQAANRVNLGPVFVNSASNGSQGSTGSLATPATSLTTGNSIVIGVRWSEAAGQTVSSVTDTAGNTYTALTKVDNAGAGFTDHIQIWYCLNATGHANNIVTATLSAACTFVYISSVQYSQVMSVDATASGTSESPNVTVNSGSFTTFVPNEVIIAYSEVGAVGATWTAGTGYTKRVTDVDNVTMFQDKIVTTVQSGVTASATSSSTNDKAISVITLTGSANFNPANISGNVIDYDFARGVFSDAGTTQVIAGGSIYQVNDQSGNGNHATQTSASLRPTWRASDGPNSKPCAEFDGTSDFLYVPNVLSALTAGEIFIVIKVDSDTNADTTKTGIWRFGTDSQRDHHRWTSDSKIYQGFGSTARKDTGTSPAAPALASWHLYNVVSTDDEFTTRVNGTQNFTTGTNEVGFSTVPIIGAGEQAASYVYLSGKIARVFMFNKKLSTAELAYVKAGIRSLYGLTIA